MAAPAILPSPEIWNRADFPALCFWRRLYRCAEVGVDRGEFASMFLDRFPQIHQWWGVDPYSPYPGMEWDRGADYQFALTRLQRHSDRARIIRLESVAAAKLFAPGAVDFVYIDGDHTLASVRADLEAWWPALSPQGILAGHDFDDHPEHAGVKQAVTEFAGARGLTVYLTSPVEGYHAEPLPSWYCYRAGQMPGPEWRRC